MTDEPMIARKEDGVGWMTFNNPQRHNALNEAMCQRIMEILADFEADPAVRLCVMTGAGEKAFVSGADIGALPEGPSSQRPAAPARAAFNALRDFNKPLVAMIRGWCLGGGVALAMKADLRIADATARFGVPAARLGVGYPLESVRDLVNLVGPSAAKSILFTAERLSAEQALRLGLADEVLAPEALQARIGEIAAAIVDNAPLSIRAAKAAVDHVSRGRWSEGEVAGFVADCLGSADFREGRSAFLEKRTPAFKGA
ncbi:enoyl-CoA hydratase-related protein [Phenylobacterium sp.]|jgi:enoyl-CoA hydratase/carnithine racemase|uniref:enoyl-CoA hydratase-related protein n=1 Tax=Phenylobacterium sp. TaxID=1871053 RepID=UPI002F422791